MLLSILASVNAFGNPSNMNILFWNVAKYIPDRILKFVLDTAPSARLIRVRHTEKVVIDVARALVHDKSSALLQAQGTKDIMSLIGQFTFLSLLTTRLTLLKSKRMHLKTRSLDSLRRK